MKRAEHILNCLDGHSTDRIKVGDHAQQANSQLSLSNDHFGEVGGSDLSAVADTAPPRHNLVVDNANRSDWKFNDLAIRVQPSS